MQLNLQLVTPPVVEPVSLALAKQHLRVDFSDDDVLIQAYIVAARQYCEKVTNRIFFNQSWCRSLDYFPLYQNSYGTRTPAQRHNWAYGQWFADQVTIDLPKPRLVAVEQITYLDNDGVEQILDPSTYMFDTLSIPGRLAPLPGTFWPIVSNWVPGGVKIKFIAGSYGDGVEINTCPQTIVMAMLLLISHWYENRSASSEIAMKSIPMGVDALLELEKVSVVGWR